MNDERIITGWWNGEPIWRRPTAEEKLERAGVSVEAARLYIAGIETNL